MRLRSLMRQRTTIQRNAPTSDMGGGSDEAWTNWVTNVPCVYWFISDQLLVSSARPEAITTRAVAVPLGVDVRVGDQLVSVTDKKGNVLLEGPLKVEDVAGRSEHIRLICQKES